MKLMKFLLRTSRRVVIFAVIAGLIAGISNTGLLVLINTALNKAGSSPPALIWGFAGLCLLMLVSRGASSVLLIRLSRWAVFDLRMKLSRQILGAPLRRLEELGAARLLASLTDDVPSISTALVNLPILCMHVAVVLTCLVYAAWLSWPVFLGVLAFMVVGILSYRLPLERGRRHMKLSRQEWDNLMKHIRALTDGTKELKLHRRRREAFLAGELEPTAQALRQHGFIGDVTFTIAAIWGRLLIFILIGLLLFGLPALTSVSTLTLTGYALIFLYMMTPLEAIMNILPTIGQANVAIVQIEELGLSLTEQTVATHDSDIRVESSAYRSLELRGVTHTYYCEDQESNFQFGPVDLQFHRGELVFLVGGNGSGKTTLAKLITGLYVPEGGEVRLNGELIHDGNREHYRQLFSVVFTDFFLFEKLLGVEIPELDARTREYLAQFHLERKVQVKDGVLSTVDLSQGQRKRLALLTAYLEDRPFYVFDEWAADQDPLFKEIFYLQLLPELKARGKTVLVISHDDRYYDVADKLIKLDYGKLTGDTMLVQPRSVLMDGPIVSEEGLQVA